MSARICVSTYYLLLTTEFDLFVSSKVKKFISNTPCTNQKKKEYNS
jgi:hypothetical protein